MLKAFDDLNYVVAGANKMGFKYCPFCRSSGNICVVRTKEVCFLFEDALSVTEYRISALCQDCQNEVFKEPDDEEMEA